MWVDLHTAYSIDIKKLNGIPQRFRQLFEGILHSQSTPLIVWDWSEYLFVPEYIKKPKFQGLMEVLPTSQLTGLS